MSDLHPQFVDFHSVPWGGEFTDIPDLSHFGAIMDLLISKVADSRDFPVPCCLADLPCIVMVEAVQQHGRFSAAVWKTKKTFLNIKKN